MRLLVGWSVLRAVWAVFDKRLLSFVSRDLGPSLFACNLPRIQDDCIQRLYKQSVENCSKGLSNSHLYKPQFPSFLRADNFLSIVLRLSFLSILVFCLNSRCKEEGICGPRLKRVKGEEGVVHAGQGTTRTQIKV